MSTQTLAHDKDMAREFLAGLDPTANRFTFQFFGDGAHTRHAEIFHGTLDEVWAKVQSLNTDQRQVGVFVTINETDLKGRRSENIVRPRALFVDADGRKQVESCVETIKKYCATPSLIVKSGRGVHFYFVCPDVPLDQFSAYQKCLIEKMGSDPAVKDLSRVMRLPGTLHLKDPTKPRLVKLCRGNKFQSWKFSQLVEKLGLVPTGPAPVQSRAQRLPAGFTAADRERVQKIFGHLKMERASDGLETNIEEIRSAAAAIPSSSISTEIEWTKSRVD